MKGAIFLVLFVLMHFIRADVGYEDLPGKYLREPHRYGLPFCGKELRIESKGNEITKMIFDGNDRVCRTDNITITEKRDGPGAPHSKAVGTYLFLQKGREPFDCGGVPVKLFLVRHLETVQSKPIGFEKTHTYIQGELYVNIYQYGVSSCIYKGVKEIPVASSIP